MFLRVAVFALMALGLLGFGGVVLVSSRPPAASAGAPPPTVSVVVAAQAVRAGSLLHPSDLAAKSFPRNEVPPGARPDTPEARHALVGAMVRRSLAQGDALREADVMHPGDHGFLAAVLRPGMRAVTVGVDAVSGTAGLIWPGDHVDLILTEAVNDPSLPPARRVAALPVLQDARVIAIDQDLVEGVTPGAPNAHPARTVTLEVSGDQAARVSVALRLGNLSLAVRAAGATASAGMPESPPEGAGTVWAGDISPALARQPEAAGAGVLRIYPGAEASKEFHF